MTDIPFDGIEACVFDAYGTLFNVADMASGARSLARGRVDALSALWRQKQLQYSWLRSLMGTHAPFWQVTGEALDHALDALSIEDEGLRAALMRLMLTPDAYPETTAVLQRLRAAGIRTAILTNGSPHMIEEACRSAGLADLLDAVFSVESVGVFKPHPDTYRLAVDGLGVEARRIAFLSSNSWDVAGAAAFGFRAIWCNRSGATRERLPFGPEAEIPTLEGLPALLGLS